MDQVKSGPLVSFSERKQALGYIVPSLNSQVPVVCDKNVALPNLQNVVNSVLPNLASVDQGSLYYGQDYSVEQILVVAGDGGARARIRAASGSVIHQVVVLLRLVLLHGKSQRQNRIYTNPFFRLGLCFLQIQLHKFQSLVNIDPIEFKIFHKAYNLL